MLVRLWPLFICLHLLSCANSDSQTNNLIDSLADSQTNSETEAQNSSKE